MTNRLISMYRALDASLGPALRNATGSVEDRALAVACAAARQNVTMWQFERWLEVQNINIPMRRFSQSPRFALIARDAARHVSDESPDLRACGLRLLRVLLPYRPGFEVSAARGVKARVAFAAVGMRVLDAHNGVAPDGSMLLPRTLEDGTVVPTKMSAALFSHPALGIDLGWTPATVCSTLNIVQDAGLARRTMKQHRGKSRWRLMPVPSQLQADLQYAFGDAVTALAEGTQHPVADLLRLVCHAAISYASTGQVGMQIAWFVALCDAAGVEPTSLGVSTTTAKKARLRWAKLMTGHDSVEEALDALDLAEGCTAQRDAAMAKAKAASEKSSQERAEFKEQQKVARAEAKRLAAAEAARWETKSMAVDASFNPRDAANVATVEAKALQHLGEGWTFDRHLKSEGRAQVKRLKRETLVLAVPAGFDVAVHGDRMLAHIAPEHGEGWAFEKHEGHKATLVRTVPEAA